MKKTYIAPTSLEHKIEADNNYLLVNSLPLDDTEVNGDQALTEEDYGILDDEENDGDIWISWKRLW